MDKNQQLKSILMGRQKNDIFGEQGLVRQRSKRRTGTSWISKLENTKRILLCTVVYFSQHYDSTLLISLPCFDKRTRLALRTSPRTSEIQLSISQLKFPIHWRASWRVSWERWLPFRIVKRGGFTRERPLGLCLTMTNYSLMQDTISETEICSGISGLAMWAYELIATVD
jgi:hypothetical protein